MVHLIRVFIGYQFRSSRFKRTEIDKILIEAFSKAESDINLNKSVADKIKIRPKLQYLLSGKAISNQILSKISAADLCIFELSDLNPNVMLELGYALGRTKPCIFLQHEDEEISKIPSDLSGVYMLRYNDDTLDAKIGYEVYQHVNNVLEKRNAELIGKATKNEDLDTLRIFWNIEKHEKAIVVCPEIPEEERLVYADVASRDYLRLAKFADLDSLYLMKDFIAHTFPEVQTLEYTSGMMPDEAYRDNLILIGGPAWNKVTEMLMDKIQSPFYYVDGGRGNDDPLIERDTNNKYLPVLNNDGTLKYDFGLFVKIPNPFNRKKFLFIINGIRTYGVLGAAKCFTLEEQAIENCNTIYKRLEIGANFAALIKIPLINNYVVPPNLATGDLISFYNYSPEDMKFYSVG